MDRSERAQAIKAWAAVPRPERVALLRAARRGEALDDPARGPLLVRWADAILDRLVWSLLTSVAVLALLVVRVVQAGHVSNVRAVLLVLLVASLGLQCSRWYGAAGVRRHQDRYALAGEQDARYG